MRSALGTVYERPSADLLCLAKHLLHGVDRTQRIADVVKRNQRSVLVDQGIDLIQHKLPILVHGEIAQFSPSAFTQHLPRHDVAVVL